jgi:viologen exporter family transport system permease protein
MRSYARVYLACVRNCLVRELEFRGNFAFRTAANLSWAGLSMVLAGLVFGNVREVAGWDLDRMFILTGTFLLVESLTASLFEQNMSKLSELVNRGELDFVLIKPISSQFLVSTRYVKFSGLPNAIVALGYVLIGAGRTGLQPGPLEVGLYLLLVVCAVLSVYALWFMTVTFVLWTGRINNIAHLIAPFVDLARVPADVFRGSVGLLVTFAIPIALIGTLPTKALLGVLQPGMAPYQVGLTGALLWASHRFWTYSLRRYSSASS